MVELYLNSKITFVIQMCCCCFCCGQDFTSNLLNQPTFILNDLCILSNLKLAHLLVERGANTNLRIPSHDMESASSAPLELLLRYYNRLAEVFGLEGEGAYSGGRVTVEETELLDAVGLQGEEPGGVGPGRLVEQARQLLLFCLQVGGDANLPTTDAAKTIYHMAATATVQDYQLLAR